MANRVIYTTPTIRHVVYTRPYDSEVEYLQCTGTQYIDTGIKASSSLTILADIDCGTTIGFPFGGANGLGNKEYAFFNSYNSQYRLGGNSVSLNRVLNIGKLTFDNTEDVKVLKVYNDNFSQTYTVSSSNFTSSYNMYLFCENRGGTITQINNNVKIYYFKMYMSGVLVRDFIPVRIGSIGYMYDKVSGKLFGNQGTGNFILGNDVANPVPKIRRVMPIHVEKEVHCTFIVFPFRTNVDEVVYTQDINRRSKSTQTPKNITYTGQSFHVWAWTENNTRNKLTCFIGCEYFYPQYGSKLFVHSSVGPQNTNGIFRGMEVTNLDFCKCWDATYITSFAAAFKDTSITDFSGIQDWNLINLTSMWEMASQLAGGRDFRPFLKMGIGDKVTNISAMFYGNTMKDTTDWSPMCSNYHWKLVSVNSNRTYLPYCNYLDMTNWDLTEWNMSNATSLFSHGAGDLKIKTPILPLTVMPMKLPYTYYDMETEQAYTEIPLNLDRQLTLYKNKSDFGK